MKSLSNNEKELVFDYHFGLTSESEKADAESLIKSHPEAAKMLSDLKFNLSRLDTLEEDLCPDELVNQTVFMVRNYASSGPVTLEDLLDKEQHKAKALERPFIYRLGGMLAAAAVILFISGALIVPLRNMRFHYWQTACQQQLAKIAHGFESYKSDHDGSMPTVAMTAGAPWWKVGDNGEENQSNTRHLWLLARQGYVDTEDFVCPGKRQGNALQLSKKQLKKYNDFPARRYVTYSLRLMCDKSKMLDEGSKKILLADLNPLFERLPDSFSETLVVQLNENLKSANSANHNRKGQNLLFCDGSVKFNKNRKTDISQDDIFTLQGTMLYQGSETPSCETDTFLAP
jgi:hypothetical protein